MFKINVGDKVAPVTKAGLCLGDVPMVGKQNQKVNTACVLRGEGVVLEVNDIVIDYSSWTYENEHGEDESYGLIDAKVPCRNLLVKCEAGVGWAGEGAVKNFP